MAAYPFDLKTTKNDYQRNILKPLLLNETKHHKRVTIKIQRRKKTTDTNKKKSGDLIHFLR